MASKKEVSIMIKATDKASKAFKDLSHKSSVALKGVAIAAAAATAAFVGLGYAIFRVGRSSLMTAVEFSKLKLALASVAGGAKQAQLQFQDMIQVAKLPGLGLEEAVRGSLRLQAVGFSAAEAKRELMAIGNALASVGAGRQQLEGVILALTQMKAKGKIAGDDLRQMANWLPQIRKAMIGAFGTGATEDITKMGVSVEEFIDKVTTQLEKLPKVTGGIANALENLSDGMKQMYNAIGQLILPLFETVVGKIAKMIDDITEIVSSQKFLDSWEGVRREVTRIVSDIAKAFGADFKTMMDAIKTSGDTFRRWLQGIDSKKVRELTEDFKALSKIVISLSVNMSKLVVRSWKLIAALGAFAILTKVIYWFSLFTKSVLVLIAFLPKATAAVKSFFETIHIGLLLTMDRIAKLSGAMKLIGVVGGAAFAALAGVIIYARREQGKYNRETEKLLENLKELRFIDVVKGQREAALAYLEVYKGIKATNEEIAKYKQMLLDMQALEKKTGKTGRFADLGGIETAIKQAETRLEGLRQKQRELADEGVAGFKRLGEAIKETYLAFFAGTEAKAAPPPEVVDAGIQKEMDDLANKLIEYREKPYVAEQIIAEKTYAALREKYKTNAKMLSLINDVQAAHEHDIWKRRMDDVKDETEKKIKTAKEARDAILKTEQEISDNVNKKWEARTALAQGAYKLEQQLAMNQLNEEKKYREAAIMALETEYQERIRAGADWVETHRWLAAQIALIDQTEELRKKEAGQAYLEWETAKMREIADMEYSIKRDVIEKMDAIREASFNSESDQIANLDRQYAYYIGNAITLGKILFNAQQQDWMRTLAGIIRTGTRMVADYLKARAMEKLKQADIAKTSAIWQKAQAEKMTALALEMTVLALAATAAGNFAAAGEYAAAAIKAGVGAAASVVAAADFERQAKVLQGEAASLMIAAVAVEAAGEIAATGLEMAAEYADEVARKEEQAAQKKQQSLDNEFQLRQDILELEGKGSEAKLLALDAELKKYQDMGLDPATLSRWYDLQQAQILSEMGATTTVSPTTAGGGITGGAIPTSSGATINVYQTNNFAGFLDTTDREQLRELAIMLQPFNKEIEDLETNP